MTKEEREEAIEYIKKYRELDAKLYQTAPFNSVAKNALTKCLRYWDMAIKALEQEPCEDTDIRLIHTQGLDVGIRCAMCTNPMANNRGCDGSCIVNDRMYKCVMEVIEDNLVEQEPTTDFDQIKAEIQSASAGEWYVGRIDGKADEVVLMDDVMGIIDKYRGEG